MKISQYLHFYHYFALTIYYLELELHGLEGGGGGDGPGAPLLADLHHGGGHGGGLPQQEPHVHLLQELLVVLGIGSGVFSLKCVHCLKVLFVLKENENDYFQ